MSEVRSTLVEGGYRLDIGLRETEGFLRKKVHFVPAASWEEGLAKLSPLAAAALDDLEVARKLVSVDRHTRFLNFAGAAELENADAEALGVLPPFPYQLDIQSRGCAAFRQHRPHLFCVESAFGRTYADGTEHDYKAVNARCRRNIRSRRFPRGASRIPRWRRR
jgi:hypothetical protein